MSKVVECRMLMPVGVVIDIEDGGSPTMTVPTFYDPKTDEVFVINRRDHDIREDVVQAVKAFVKDRSHTIKGGPLVAEAVDPKTWDQIRMLSGLAKPPVQEQ